MSQANAPLFHRWAGLDAEELAILVDAVQDYAIFLLSPEGRIRSWNAGAERIMGYTADEAIGHHFSMFYGPDDLAAHKPANELLIAGREGRIEDEGWRLRKDGRRFFANTIITALRNPDGSIRAFAKVTRDMTERREALEQLRASEEMFRLLVASVKDYAIFMLDPDGNVMTWNAGAQRIKGYTTDDIVGHHFSAFYPEEDKSKSAYLLDMARKNGSVEDEGWRVRKDGSRFWADVVITAIRDAHGELRGFAKVTRDVTERKEAEETRRALLEQREARLQAEEERRRAEASYRAAQEANRAKDEFLMTLSHELRTPMTAILGWSRLLPSMAPDDPIFHEAITAIARSAELQTTLIDDVLDVSRIVSGKLRLNVEPVNVAHIVNASVDAVRTSADARGIAINTSLAPGLGTIVADPTRIQQVLWNLLMNAVKFSPKETGVIDLAARRTSSHVQFTVRDNGEGIDPNFLPHMFEAFRQAENPSTRVHGGLGLGLSIVRHLVEAHGGSISAESAGRGHGATFTVTLPVAALKTEPVAAKTGRTPPPTAAPIGITRLTGINILLVDDDVDTRAFVAAVLRHAGARVTTCDSAQGALDNLASQRPDLLLTDIAMPEIDGFALTRKVREQPAFADLKIVALSAFNPSKVNTDTTFAAYLTKPIDPAELVDAVAKVVGR